MPPLLEIKQVTKRFAGCVALKGVSLSLHAGEVVALIGENGAGKSTLMKILAGVQSHSEGEIWVDGQQQTIDGVVKAQQLGIALIHQELNLADNLDVGANIFLGREPTRLGLIDRSAINRQSQELLSRVGLNVSPKTLVSKLSVGQQQLVEIAKALSIGARVLIMDEPTSSLSQHETLKLFEVIQDLKTHGVAIIYISHRLGEVSHLADRVVVFRDGANAGELTKSEATHDAMVKLMVGRDLTRMSHRNAVVNQTTVLKVDNLITARYPLERVSFSLRAGEIAGIAGLVGAGRTELLETLFGARPALGGEVEILGHKGVPRSPRQAIQRGMTLVPEDRKQLGLVIDWPIRHNVGLPGHARARGWGGWLNRRRERTDAREAISKLSIKTKGAEKIVGLLSGGNQQKVVLGKWLALGPKILLLDEPTRGIDIGAKQEIYQLLFELAAQGMSILFVSSELEEVLRLADRALVMHEGRLTGELNRSEFSEEAIMTLATSHEASVTH